MCDDCKSLTIPIGETGATGATGAAGTNGTNGTNGTSAYKLIKTFTTSEIEQNLTVSYLERATCEVTPDGCVVSGTDLNLFVDIHVQMWYFVVLQGSSYWQLLTNTPTLGTYTFNCKVDGSTGNMTLTTGGAIGIFRVVILG
jgi:hypothetical protein